MHLGDVIYNFRMAHNKMSLMEFAKLAKLSTAYINQLERNINPKTGESIVPSLETFYKVANAMDISLDELLSKVDENQPVGLNGVQSYEKPYSSERPLPSNIITPSAHAVPILGTICAGSGVYCEENFEGYFYVDRTIKADYCLKVKGDSMIDAGIYDGDVAFIRKEFDYEDGEIYAVCWGAEESASLKKLYKVDNRIMLQPCNAEYSAILADADDVCIVGECVGTYHAR
ncbi:helix-turn-helix domain-containing protein [Mogibacterium sp. CM50]|jgi:lexA repressor|uniref:helix-turn-helix domain-containing protein n=1 Tax=Mogibacterium sp. CM50 TaxID=936375 RepID=UPI00027C35C9|nr:S24 family peptidase [Mogibacterium sp. CM50]EJU21609.1 peptidase S24-like protein [Mogibacterium sp. CM50]